MLKLIIKELKAHSPFTVLGALTGVAIAFLFQHISPATSHNIFYVLHPAHVVLSALVTVSMFRTHNGGSNIWLMLIVGYFGSVGIATLSDSVIPFIGEVLLDVPNRGIHLGFIDKWWLVNPLALIGVAIAYFVKGTKFPHTGHVLLSTWASVFHLLMGKVQGISTTSSLVIFVFLFIAVWFPCCLSDIVFPLLVARRSKNVR